MAIRMKTLNRSMATADATAALAPWSPMSFHTQAAAPSEPRPITTVQLAHNPGRDFFRINDEPVSMASAPTTRTISGSSLA